MNALVLFLAVMLCGCEGIPGMWPGDFADWGAKGEDTGSGGRYDPDPGPGPDSDSDPDSDGDGYKSTASGGEDCDDEDASINPGASETWYDGVDQDCDGASDFDADGDEYDSDAYDGQDCDDEDASIHPGVVSDHEGISMAYICPGTFTMGSPSSEVGRDADVESEHEVTLTAGFYIGIHEVTQAEFEGFMGYDPSYWPGCTNCPVEDIDWGECAALANAVSDAAYVDRCYDCTGACVLDASYETPYACEGYRLPTEAEWEYVARAGTSTAFSNGGNLLDTDSDGNGTDDQYECDSGVELDNSALLEDIAVYCANNSGQTEEVGSTEPNPWGVHDMHGSILEWCHDRWEGHDYGGDTTDPVGDQSGDRVLRGGSWISLPMSLRSATRASKEASYFSSSVGCRLARSE